MYSKKNLLCFAENKENIFLKLIPNHFPASLPKILYKYIYFCILHHFLSLIFLLYFSIYMNDTKKHQKTAKAKKIAKRETVVEFPGKCGRRHYDCQVCKTFISLLFLFMFINVKVSTGEVFLRVRNICNILIPNIFGETTTSISSFANYRGCNC